MKAGAYANNKLMVTSKHIIAKASRVDEQNRVYFEIEYVPVYDTEPFIGFGSYYLDNVQKWFNEELELVELGDEEIISKEPVEPKQETTVINNYYMGSGWYPGEVTC